MNRKEIMLFQKIKELIPKDSNVILDVASGDCALPLYLAEKFKSEEALPKIIGIDISTIGFPSKFQLIRKKVKCKKADVVDTLLSPETADAIICVHSLHHFKAPLKALKEMHKVLKKKGTLIIADYLAGSSGEKIYHEKYFSVKDVNKMLNKVGLNFNEIKIEKINKEEMLITAKK